MAHTENNNTYLLHEISLKFLQTVMQKVVVSVFMFFISPNIYAGNWVIGPTLDVAEIYSDNVILSQSNKQSDLITEVNPGVSIRGEGRRVKASINYRMKNLIFANNSSRNSISNQLLGNVLTELSRDYLYVDVNGRISQALIRPSNSIPLVGVNSANVSNVYTYGVKPYFQHNFDNLYNVYAGYGYNEVRYSNVETNDAIIRNGEVRIDSGARFTRLTWRFSHKNKEIIRQPSNNFISKESFVSIGYQVFDDIKVLAVVGSDKYDFATSRQTFSNGTYQAAGFDWTPGRILALEGLYGNRYKSATLTISPTIHTSLDVKWLKRSVGLNPGVQWSGNFHLRTRRSNVLASYFKNTVTSQALAISNLGNGFYDPITGQFYLAMRDPSTGFLIPVDPTTGQPVATSVRNSLIYGTIGGFGISNQAFIRKRSQIVYGFHTARSNISLFYARERRTYLISNKSILIDSYSASWGWRITGLSRLLTGVVRTKTAFQSGRKNDFYLYSVAINKRVSAKVHAVLSYQRRVLNSSQPGIGYTENRITASLNMAF